MIAGLGEGAGSQIKSPSFQVTQCLESVVVTIGYLKPLFRAARRYPLDPVLLRCLPEHIADPMVSWPSAALTRIPRRNLSSVRW